MTRASPQPRPLRVGIINIMPQAERYEGYLRRPLQGGGVPAEPVWLRLATHGYTSSDREHMDHHYVLAQEALAHDTLDGLLLTGAPVEDRAFEEVRYWDELREVLTLARVGVPSTLGLCWGGLALGKVMGVDKKPLPRKLFGVFGSRALVPHHPIVSGDDEGRFMCAHSRHAGLDDSVCESAQAAGQLRLLAYGPEAGYSMFESADGRFLAHLGHPEYEPARLVHEWDRDRLQGRTDVDPPAHFDLAQPVDSWRDHRNLLFTRWLGFLASQRRPVDARDIEPEAASLL